MAVLVTSYSETEKDGTNDLKSIHPASSGFSATGEAFSAPETFTLTLAKFHMCKVGSPIGTGYARLYAITGTAGTDGKPTGAALASSAGLDVSTLGTGFALISFDFTGDSYELQNATGYCIMFENPTSGTINADNYTSVSNDSTGSYATGNYCRWWGGAWGSDPNYDTCFYVYKADAPAGGRTNAGARTATGARTSASSRTAAGARTAV